MFETRGLVKRFGAMTVTDEVSITVEPGEIHALIGPNGAGKSTLVNLIAGVLREDQGEIRLNGTQLTQLSVQGRKQAGLGRSFQLTSLFREFTVEDNLLLAIRSCSRRRISCFASARADSQNRRKARELAESVGIASRLQELAGAIPHGAQRALDVAMVLACDPKLILLDEPLAGMGPEDAGRMIDLISGLRTEAAVLLIEHDMGAVFRLADRVTVLERGKVLVSGSPEQVRGSAKVQDVYLGRDH